VQRKRKGISPERRKRKAHGEILQGEREIMLSHAGRKGGVQCGWWIVKSLGEGKRGEKVGPQFEEGGSALAGIRTNDQQTLTKKGRLFRQGEKG